MITLPTRTPRHRNERELFHTGKSWEHGTKLRSGVRRLLNEFYDKRSEDDTFADGLSPVITRLRARVQVEHREDVVHVRAAPGFTIAPGNFEVHEDDPN